MCYNLNGLKCHLTAAHPVLWPRIVGRRTSLFPSEGRATLLPEPGLPNPALRRIVIQEIPRVFADILVVSSLEGSNERSQLSPKLKCTYCHIQRSHLVRL